MSFDICVFMFCVKCEMFPVRLVVCEGAAHCVYAESLCERSVESVTFVTVRPYRE